MEWTVTIPVKINREFVDDLMCTALEGGICYWVDSVDIVDPGERKKGYASEVIAQGGIIRLNLSEGPIEDDGPEYYDLDINKFLKGLEMFWEDQSDGNEMVDVDPANFDAEMVDTIIQYAIFGEQVFG